MNDEKWCPHCERMKPATDFTKDRSRKDGLNTYCRNCTRTASKKWREANPEKSRAIVDAWRKTHRENCLGYYRTYYQRHQQQRLADAKSYREAHHPEIRAYSAKWKREHRAWHVMHVNQWRLRHPEQHRIIWETQKRARRARLSGAPGLFTDLQWRDLKNQYDKTCLCCGRREPAIKLTPDHVVPLAKGGTNGIENIQPLCLSCNARKQANTIDYRPGWQSKITGRGQLFLFDEESER